MGGYVTTVDIEMGVLVRSRELAAYEGLKLQSFSRKLPGPQFGVRLREVSASGGSTVRVLSF